MSDPLFALVTSKARAKVLEAIFSLPPRAYFQQELAREADLPLVAVQRELKRLVAADLVRVEAAAGRKVFVANDRSAIHVELSSIIIKLRGVVPRLRPAVRRGELAWVFGSFASGTATAASDVDLMVIGDTSPRELRDRIGPIEKKIARSINEHVVGAATWTRRLSQGDGFLTNVREGPKLWVTGDEAALSRLDPPR